MLFGSRRPVPPSSFSHAFMVQFPGVWLNVFSARNRLLQGARFCWHLGSHRRMPTKLENDTWLKIWWPFAIHYSSLQVLIMMMEILQLQQKALWKTNSNPEIHTLRSQDFLLVVLHVDSLLVMFLIVSFISTQFSFHPLNLKSVRTASDIDVFCETAVTKATRFEQTQNPPIEFQPLPLLIKKLLLCKTLR